MTFITILIALLIERFFDWSHLRKWNWYLSCQDLVLQKLPTQSPYVILAVTIVPMLLVVGLVELMLNGTLYGFTTLIFKVFVLLYCLGPQNLWADTYAGINATGEGSQAQILERFKSGLGSKFSDETSFLSHIMLAVNQRIFAVVFWFMLAGPIGALLYRLLCLSAYHTNFAQQGASQVTEKARLIVALFDWLPIRILTFVFALAGHFVNAFTCWRKKVLLGVHFNEAILTECGGAALGFSTNGDAQGTLEKSAVNLIDRGLVIWVVCIAILQLVFHVF